MEKYRGVLKQTQLFFGVEEAEILTMLSCLNARAVSFQKGDYVLRQGDQVDSLAVLVEGELHMQTDDYWGNRSILGQITVGEMFGEAYAAPESGPIALDVVAVADSTVLLFDVKRIITTCSSACRFHTMVVQNLFFALSERNRKLVGKLSHMSKRTTREKLISYLSEEAKRHRSANFTIPFNRQQLADFLSVDRSAMSAELSKMRAEGLLEFERNQFHLL